MQVLKNVCGRLLLLALLSCFSLSAEAQEEKVVLTVAEKLEEARAVYDDLEYLDASQRYMEIIVDPRATDEHLLEANMYSGIIQRVLGNSVEARLHFAKVLRMKPDAKLPDNQAPKIVVFFDLVRQDLQSEVAVPPVEQNEAAAPSVEQSEGEGAEQILLISAVGVSATAVVALALFSTAGLVSESRYYNAEESYENRESAGQVAQISWIGAFVSLGGLALGAVLAGVGAVQ